MGSDFWLVFRWWGALFLIGASAYPLTRYLFRGWHDEGYLFTKAVGLAVVTWFVYALGTLKVLPFTNFSIVTLLLLLFASGVAINLKSPIAKKDMRMRWKTIILEELFFFAALLFWSWIKGHEPSIRGLEKFMDFGFMKSALTSRYFPPADMWYAGYHINYYYFGHIATALLSRLSGVDLRFGFNIMLATIFAWTLTMSYSIAFQIFKTTLTHTYTLGRRIIISVGSVITAFLVSLGGNLQTIYAFTQGYSGEDVKPFWELLWPFSQFLQKLPEGLNRYWYANATRFIPYSIHEFPSYSFVVSDVHGHVLSLPFVLLAIAFLIHYFGIRNPGPARGSLFPIVFFGFLVGVLLMTNALDGPIYLLLFLALLVTVHPKSQISLRQSFDQTQDKRSGQVNLKKWKRVVFVFGLVAVVSFVASLPFLSHFKSFVTGLAVNCPIDAMANSRIGPIIFEGIEKCQRSPFWMFLILWGLFLYCGIWFLSTIRNDERIEESRIHTILTVFFFISVTLILFPEFFYFKDIYPAHFRSNTMFKLGYQAFILFAIVSGVQITRMVYYSKKLRVRLAFFLLLMPLLFLVSIFPIFSIRSYFNGLKIYEGIDGLAWLRRDYPDDYAAIEWLQKETGDTRQATREKRLVLVEADGDSYTDYDRFSVFTGIPTVVGWAVHEWLWRGTYDVVAPRREEVRRIYESIDLEETRRILQKYQVAYIVIGTLERERFSTLREAKFNVLGRVVFRSGSTFLYQID